MPRVYDKVTHRWEKSYDSGKTSGKTSGRTTGNSTSNKKKDDDSGLSTKSSNKKKSAKGKTVKKVNKKTLRTLEGSLSYLANENTIKIHPRDTIKLDNLGKYLSGKYYVSEVTRTISTGGYSQSAKVIKTNFRKSLKVVAKKTTLGKKKK